MGHGHTVQQLHFLLHQGRGFRGDPGPCTIGRRRILVRALSDWSSLFFGYFWCHIRLRTMHIGSRKIPGVILAWTRHQERAGKHGLALGFTWVCFSLIFFLISPHLLASVVIFFFCFTLSDQMLYHLLHYPAQVAVARRPDVWVRSTRKERLYPGQRPTGLNPSSHGSVQFLFEFYSIRFDQPICQAGIRHPSPDTKVALLSSARGEGKPGQEPIAGASIK